MELQLIYTRLSVSILLKLTHIFSRFPNLTKYIKVKIKEIKREVNQMTNRLALHERLETHELLTLKNVSLTKISLMEPLVQDEKLKAILSKERKNGKQSVERLQQLLGGDETWQE